MRFVNTSKYPLRVEDGGPLLCTDKHIRKVINGNLCPISYVTGMVSNKVEKFSGHHATRTMGVIDEASGVEAAVFDEMEKWAKKMYVFGNPLSVGSRFYAEVKGGDLLAIE